MMFHVFLKKPPNYSNVGFLLINGIVILRLPSSYKLLSQSARHLPVLKLADKKWKIKVGRICMTCWQAMHIFHSVSEERYQINSPGSRKNCCKCQWYNIQKRQLGRNQPVNLTFVFLNKMQIFSYIINHPSGPMAANGEIKLIAG